MRLYASLTKVEEQDDGTIRVFGVASSATRDEAGEIILPEAMKAAIPDYMAFGAVREMHQPKAAGTALECSVDDDGVTQFGAHVVDPLAVQKVKTGVYKGFSIGGKVLARDPLDRTTITKIKLNEISLVDRPCNNDATLNLWKAADIAGPEGDDMSEKTYQPTNEAVKAHATELAKAASKPDRVNDYLVKARDELVAKGPPADPAAAITGNVVVEGSATAEASVTDPEKVDPAVALGKALEAAQAAAGPVASDVASPVTPGLAELGKGLVKLGELYGDDPLAKGFWCISDLAQAVQCLVSMQESAFWEAKSHPDMQAPAMLAAAAQAAGAALLQYVKEILANAMINMQANGAPLEVVVVDGDEAIMLAAAVVDLVKADTALMEKAGKRNSAQDQKHVQAAHDSAVKAGATCADPASKAGGTDDLAKVTADRDRFADALEKAVPVVEELKGAVIDLKARLEKVEAQPMPSKTAGSSLATVRAVEKVADAGGPSETSPALSVEQMQKALDALPPAERAHLIMKAAMARPIPIQP